MSAVNDSATTTYLNPVYDLSFPDPFVLKFAGEYWAYCTGFWHDGRAFGVLRSRDLVNWRALAAGALEPLPGGHPCYWAPEVVYDNGRFLMYYSVGNETTMVIRVAVADHPAGPFADSGRGLTTEEFAIDPHVFADEDGTRWLFYATDFLRHTHVGTGTVVDRMLDPPTLAGEPRPVTRARYDWQVYDPARKEKGGVRWHTVEGPSVVKYKGRYYEMFSGGNWQNTTYGVSYAVSDRILTEGEWEQHADGLRVLPVLRTLPGQVVGPGHNSVVRGPDNRQLFCIYHRWAEGDRGRVMAIDRLNWAGGRMIVLGPSTTPQPAPLRPAFADFFDDERAENLSGGWECVGGRWTARGGEARQEAADGEAESEGLAGAEAEAEARCLLAAPCLLVEVMARSLSESGGPGAYGLSLLRGDGVRAAKILLRPATRSLEVDIYGEDARATSVRLPDEFDPRAFHLLRLEFDSPRLRVRVDEGGVRWEGELHAPGARVALYTERARAAFRGFALTIGWESLFLNGGEDIRAHGWEPPEGASAADWTVDREGKELRFLGGDLLVSEAERAAAPGGLQTVVKGPLLESYELVVNARAAGAESHGSGYGFYPALGAGARGPLLQIVRQGEGWALEARDAGSPRRLALPRDFDPREYQQFRFTKRGRRLDACWEGVPLGTVEVPEGPARVGLYAGQSGDSFDLVRVTMIEEMGAGGANF